MKAAEGNVRRGPSLTHRIDWVFKRRGMPLQITAEYGNWRKVQDRDGAGGWVHYALLSGVRTVLIESEMLPSIPAPTPILRSARNSNPAWWRAWAVAAWTGATSQPAVIAAGRRNRTSGASTPPKSANSGATAAPPSPMIR